MLFPVADGHCDTALRLLQGAHLNEHSEAGHLDLPRMALGGVKLQIFALYVEPEYKPGGALVRTLALWDALHQELRRCQEQLELLTRRGQLAVWPPARPLALISLEGAEALGDGDLAVLRALFHLGVRACGLTWNGRNLLADGAGEHPGGPLSASGVRVVAEMERLGMAVDVSHLSVPSFWHLLEVAERPAFASHSNARALCEHARNLDDAQLRAIAAQGGVVGLNFYGPFLRRDGVATLDDLLAHYEHIAGLIGSEHVALGSDFDGAEPMPEGIFSCADVPKLAEALLRRNVPESHVRQLMSENLVQYLQHVLPEEELH